MANEACTFSQLLPVGGKRSNWYSGTNRADKVSTGVSVGKMKSAVSVSQRIGAQKISENLKAAWPLNIQRTKNASHTLWQIHFPTPSGQAPMFMLATNYYLGKVKRPKLSTFILI